MSEPFRYYLRVRYGECDAQKVVYNARYGDYIDLAATEFLRAAFAPRNVFDGSFEFQVVRLLVEWKGPARFDDVLDISVRVTKMGTTSYTAGFEIRRKGEPDLLVSGETVNVHAHGGEGVWTKAPIPADIREALLHGAVGKRVDHAG
jgi:acyl-CoA thioester hydrolase